MGRGASDPVYRRITGTAGKGMQSFEEITWISEEDSVEVE